MSWNPQTHVCRVGPFNSISGYTQTIEVNESIILKHHKGSHKNPIVAKLQQSEFKSIIYSHFITYDLVTWQLSDGRASTTGCEEVNTGVLVSECNCLAWEHIENAAQA